MNKFYFKDCTLSTLATGEKAQNLKELFDRLSFIDSSSIYHHFWDARLSPHYETHEYLNDFAIWCFTHLHDQTLAERLAIIDPKEYGNVEDLRKELLQVIKARIAEVKDTESQSFYFATSKIMIFDTSYTASSPKEMAEILPKLPLGSIFYHFIDGQGRTAKDDFTVWLESFPGNEPLIQKLSEIDSYFCSLNELQKTLSHLFLEQNDL